MDNIMWQVAAFIVAVLVLCYIVCHNRIHGMYKVSDRFLADSGLTEGYLYFNGNLVYIYAANETGIIQDANVSIKYSMPNSLGNLREYTITFGKNSLFPEKTRMVVDYSGQHITIYDKNNVLFDVYYSPELNDLPV